MTAATPSERGARVGVLHHLHPDHRVDFVGAVAADLVALHATDPASVYLGLRARLQSVSVVLEIERTRLREFLGDVRVAFRFSSPLHRRLVD